MSKQRHHSVLGATRQPKTNSARPRPPNHGDKKPLERLLIWSKTPIAILLWDYEPRLAMGAVFLLVT